MCRSITIPKIHVLYIIILPIGNKCTKGVIRACVPHGMKRIAEDKVEDSKKNLHYIDLYHELTWPTVLCTVCYQLC